MTNNNKLITFLICSFIFIVAVLTYSNTLGNDFIWDDEYLILKNSQIKHFSHIGNVFKTYVGYGSENINNFYRPIQETSNMIDYFLWGLHPSGYHLTNIILHSLVAVFLYIFLTILTKNKKVSFITAVIWSVHPVHTEAVAYIAGRADSLYALFMMLAFIFFIKHVKFLNLKKKTQSNLNYYFSIVAFIIALLSKEVAIVFPIFIFLYLIYFTKDKKTLFNKIKWKWAPYAFIAGIYVWLRATVLNFSNISPESLFKTVPLPYRILTFFRTLLIYFKLMLIPTNLHMERTVYITKTVLDPLSLFALIIVAILIWSIFKLYKTNKMVSFFIAWFFINLLPLSNIFPINSLLAEHWLYMASIGPLAIVAMGLVRFYEKVLPEKKAFKIASIFIFICFISGYAVLTINQNMIWKDEISFFHNTLKYNPRNARLYLNLGNTYYEKGELEKAIKEYKKALEINKNYAIAYGNIGSSYLKLNKPNEAEKYLIKAIKTKFNYPIAHYNLGILFFKKGLYNEALKELNLTIKQLPQFFPAHNMLGQVYLKKGRKKEARESFQKSLMIMPDQPAVSNIIKNL